MIDVVRTAEGQRPRWLDLTVDLSRWAGREVTLEFHAALTASPRRTGIPTWWPGDRSGCSAWTRAPSRRTVRTSSSSWSTPCASTTSPPTATGATPPPTSRALAGRAGGGGGDRVLAGALDPPLGDLLHDQPPARGGPRRRRRGLRHPAGRADPGRGYGGAGYETGGFFANKILHSGNGFARGFGTFFSPLDDPAAQAARGDDQPDAAELTGRVLPWVEAHRNQPFFLYVHYIDPHDPYDNPEIVDNRSPFEPPCPGCVSGRHIQGSMPASSRSTTRRGTPST